MLQAEIAGSLVPSPEGSPAKGAVIRDFQLPAAEGRLVLLSDYRFGEVFAAFNLAQGANLPGFEDIRSWIDLINRQCPECGPREWA